MQTPGETSEQKESAFTFACAGGLAIVALFDPTGALVCIACYWSAVTAGSYAHKAGLIDG